MLDLPVIYNDHPVQEQAINNCIVEVAKVYKLDPLLLRAIREQERGDLGKENPNTDGSRDMGPFQINSIHLKSLREGFGMTEARVTSDACANAAVAAWHLRNKINENDGDIWKGVAWYHSKTPAKGRRYRKFIMTIYERLVRKVNARHKDDPQLAGSGDY